MCLQQVEWSPKAQVTHIIKPTLPTCVLSIHSNKPICSCIEFDMVLLVIERLCHSLKLSSKLENHHHHHQPSDDALSASLQAFQSDISNSLNQLSSNLKPESEFLSLLWIHQCLELLPNINQAFAKLVMDINYPIRNWDGPSIEE